MDFENVNVNVTRKSFGSRVDKEFQREGVIPIKDRSKANEYDYTAESAKYNELNKKVETRRLTDVKESRAFNIALQEGYNKVRDVLIKDFMSEIVVESLLVDKEVVDNNLKSIVLLVEEQVDAIGGYNGIKEIAESTGNQLLNNIIAACEAVCAKVGKRNLQESEGKASKLDFGISRDEFEEYNYLKQSNGSETIIDIVKDKVYNVIKDEQETNAKNQAVMNEIESKIKELEAPVNEAMDAIFNKVGIEESSLFNSLMRSHYAQLLETNSSAIFEADTIDDETIDAFEDEEFKMSEIELLGNDGEGEDPMDDDSEDEIVEEGLFRKSVEEIDEKIKELKRRLKDITDDEYYDANDPGAKLAVDSLKEKIEKLEVKKAKQLKKVKESTEEIVEEASIQKKARKYKDEKLAKKIVKKEEEIARVKARLAMEKDEDYKADMKEDIQILQQELKVLKNEYTHRDRQSKIKTNFYAKEAGEMIDILTNGTVEQLSEALDNFAIEIETEAASCRTKSSAKKCKEAVREIQNTSDEIVEEGVFADIDNAFTNTLHKTLLKTQSVKGLNRLIEEETKAVAKMKNVLESRETEKTLDIVHRLVKQTVIWSLNPGLAMTIFKANPHATPKWLLNKFIRTSENFIRLAEERKAKLESGKEVVAEGVPFDGAKELEDDVKYADVRKTSNIDLVASKPEAEDAEMEICNDKACEATKPSVADIFALMEARCGSKKVKEETENPDIAPSLNNEKPVKEGCKKVKEEVEEPLDEEIIICPVCGEENCVCDTVTESVASVIKSVKNILSPKARKQAKELKQVKADIEQAKKDFTAALDSIDKRSKAEYFIAALMDLTEKYRASCKNDPNKERVQLMLSYCDWLDGFQKTIAKKATALESYEVTVEGLSFDELKANMKNFLEKLSSRSVAKSDFTQVRVNLQKMLDKAKNIKTIDTLKSECVNAIAQLNQAKKYYPDAKEKIDGHINWIKNEFQEMLTKATERIQKKTVVESFIDRLDNSCDILSNVIETHEVALNGVLESMTHEIDDKLRVVPYLQPNDCNLSNLEFAYKAKLVCESLKEGAMHIASEADTDIVTRAIELNVNSINESLVAIQGMDKLNYKAKMLESCKQYLGRVQAVLDNGIAPNETVTESTALFNSVEDVDRIFNQVKEYTLIESTNNDLMELVMAEAIVEYTIMEAFNTLNLVNYNKDSVRQMARRNISK